MKKLIYLIMAVWAFTSCNDSDEAFTVEISAEGFHFTPIMGGALLQYTLPDDPEIIAINVRYQDVYGMPCGFTTFIGLYEKYFHRFSLVFSIICVAG